jgi:hypothetical protein
MKMKRPDGVVLIALWYFLIGTVLTLGALTILVLPMAALWFERTGMDRMVGMWGLGIGFMFTASGAVLSFLTGWGLLRLKEWARWLAMGLALFKLLLFPLGTVAGVLILAYLLQAGVKAVFEQNAMTAAKT